MRFEAMMVVSCVIAVAAAACEERGGDGERTARRSKSADAGAAVEDDKTTLSTPLPSDTSAPSDTTPPSLPGPTGTTTIVPAIPSDIVIEPANGQLFDARTEDREVKFSGFTDVASAAVDVQVLTRPDAPITESSWVTVGSTTSSAAPTSGEGAPLYRWSTTAVPSPKGTNRWLPGGLLRYRTVMNVAGKRSALPFYDTTAGKCIAEAGAKGWKDVLERCKSPFSPMIGATLGGSARAAALVSVTELSKNPPPYLSRRGDISAAETDAYYALIDAPKTLTEYKTRFGFDDEKDVIEATYFNAGDLGIGREMHCRSFNNAAGTGIACYVRNYGVDKDLKPVFGGDQKSALDDAIARNNPFATVAMVKFGNKFAPVEGNDVQFFVYLGPTETLVNRAPLDNFGLNQAIPNNCLNCHGGKNEGAGKVVGASFLPFDPEAFRYAPDGPRTYAAQEENFRKLNALVASAGMPPPIVQYVDGLYGGKQDTPGTKANLDWMPKGWTETEEAKTVYREVYKPYCRTCHISQVGDFAFMRFAEFTKHSRLAAESVCDTHEMPIAEVTTEAFNNSPARAYLVNTLGLSTPCGVKQ